MIVRFEQVVLRGQIVDRLYQVPSVLTVNRVRRFVFRLKGLSDCAEQEIALDGLFEPAPLRVAPLGRSVDGVKMEQSAAGGFDRMFDNLSELSESVAAPTHHVDLQMGAPLEPVSKNPFVDTREFRVIAPQ